MTYNAGVFVLSFACIVSRGSSFVHSSPVRPSVTAGCRHNQKCRATSVMEIEAPPLDRRELVRAAGGAMAAWAAASTLSPAVAAIATRDLARDAIFCDDAVSHLRSGRREVWLVGTAHISNASALLVEQVIRSVEPDIVMVELDQSRVGGFLTEASAFLSGSLRAHGGNVVQGPRKKTSFFKMVMGSLFDPSVSFSDHVNSVAAAVIGKTISSMYDSMDKLGFVSGQEFTVAIREARLMGAKILLGDRDVKVTLRRLTEALRATDLNRLADLQLPELQDSMEGINEKNEASKISGAVEVLKQRQIMQKLSKLMEDNAPEIYNAMLGERDQYMANSLNNCEGVKMVAVVGLAHLDGIERNLGSSGWRRLPCR
ncbi:unnamed protein product [Discosporangium mesarthrocarpum]